MHLGPYNVLMSFIFSCSYTNWWHPIICWLVIKIMIWITANRSPHFFTAVLWWVMRIVFSQELGVHLPLSTGSWNSIYQPPVANDRTQWNYLRQNKEIIGRIQKPEITGPNYGKCEYRFCRGLVTAKPTCPAPCLTPQLHVENSSIGIQIFDWHDFIRFLCTILCLLLDQSTMTRKVGY